MAFSAVLPEVELRDAEVLRDAEELPAAVADRSVNRFTLPR